MVENTKRSYVELYIYLKIRYIDVSIIFKITFILSNF